MNIIKTQIIFVNKNSLSKILRSIRLSRNLKTIYKFILSYINNTVLIYYLNWFYPREIKEEELISAEWQ